MKHPRVHVITDRLSPGRRAGEAPGCEVPGREAPRHEAADRSPIAMRVTRSEPATHRRQPIRIERNAMIDWLRATGRPAAELFEWLLDVDRATGQSLGPLYALERPADRLAATLFHEYAAAQGLSAGEAAMLLNNAADHARAAVVWLGLQRRAAS